MAKTKKLVKGAVVAGVALGVGAISAGAGAGLAEAAIDASLAGDVGNAAMNKKVIQDSFMSIGLQEGDIFICKVKPSGKVIKITDMN